ncbi:MAG TPA: hypothetical protein VJ851_07655 [Jatrophihabitans sp.]|nr:hypothetical protein [Jatrophihabitans sp.]
MTAAASFQPGYVADPGDELDAAELFDDSDGAYAVAEPDPFADSSPISARPSLRAELGATAGRQLAGSTRLRPALPPLPVPDQLAELLPGGLRRGSTIAVTGSVSLLLTLLGAASQHGAWTALVGMPAISAEAAAEAGLDLGRLAMVTPTDGSWTGTSWTTAVGALLDALDVVVARPAAIGTRSDEISRPGLVTGRPGMTSGRPGVTVGDSRRLTARARTKDAVLVLYGRSSEAWPAVELKLSAEHTGWTGIGTGYGRLAHRRLLVTATGRGRSSRPRTAELLL